MEGKPLAFFLTIATYGTWRPGDDKGWVKNLDGEKKPDPVLHSASALRQTETSIILTPEMRECVHSQVRETCKFRGWKLWAVNCRTTLLHCALTPKVDGPKKVRTDIKAWTARRLKENFESNRSQWWAERGSIRWILDEESLRRVIHYVLHEQD